MTPPLPLVGVLAVAAGRLLPLGRAAPPSLAAVANGSPAPVLAALSTDCLLASDMRLCNARARVCCDA